MAAPSAENWEGVVLLAWLVHGLRPVGRVSSVVLVLLGGGGSAGSGGGTANNNKGDVPSSAGGGAARGRSCWTRRQTTDVYGRQAGSGRCEEAISMHNITHHHVCMYAGMYESADYKVRRGTMTTSREDDDDDGTTVGVVDTRWMPQ